MRTREDQQRLKELLKDTITLLCKNGLQFKDELSVEALIGITLDQDNVFLVNIKETVQLQKNGNASESSDASDNEESNKNERLSSPRSAKKRPHSSSSHTAGITPSKQQRLTSGIKHGNKGLETIVSVKTEIDNEDDNDDEDLVFVKEEQHSHNAGQLSSPVGGVYPVSFGSSVINMGSGTSMSGDLSMHNKSNTSLDSSAFLQHSPGAWGGTKTSGNQQLYDGSIPQTVDLLHGSVLSSADDYLPEDILSAALEDHLYSSRPEQLVINNPNDTTSVIVLMDNPRTTIPKDQISDNALDSQSDVLLDIVDNIKVNTLIEPPSNDNKHGRPKKSSVRYSKRKKTPGTYINKSYPVSLKLEAVYFAELPDVTNAIAAKKFNVCQKQIREWRKKKEVYLKIMTNGQGFIKRLNATNINPIITKTKSPIDMIQLRLLAWTNNMKDLGIMLSRNMIKVKAMEIHQSNQETNTSENEVFDPSEEWLGKFIKKHKITVFDV